MQAMAIVGTAILTGSMGFMLGAVAAASGKAAEEERLKQAFSVQLGRARLEERNAGIAQGRAEGYEKAEREIQARIAAARLLEEGA